MQTVVMIREKTFGALGGQLDRFESETSVFFQRSQAGYTITATPVSIEMTRDGEQVQDPLGELLKDVVVTYRVGDDGQIQGIDGFGGLVERLQSSFPPDIAKALAPMVNEQALVSREVAEWNGRIGDFAGAMVSIGESIDAEVPFTLPNGESIVYFTRTSFPGLENCPAGTCVRVELVYDSEASAIARIASDVAAGVAAALEAEPTELTASGSRLSGSASRLIDPDTMLIYEETQSRIMSMTMEIPGRGRVPTIMKEERRYSFEYQ